MLKHWATSLLILPLVPALCFAAPLTATPQVIENSLAMKFVLIPAGEFMMGSDESPDALAKDLPLPERKRFVELADEAPVHRVHISRAYYLGQHEVTVGQFRRFVQASGYTPEAEADGTGGTALTRPITRTKRRAAMRSRGATSCIRGAIPALRRAISNALGGDTDVTIPLMSVIGLPVVRSFNPATGAAGTTVIITGNGFDATPANNTVTFNGVAATVSAATKTQLSVPVPAGATTGTITVTTANGSAASATSFTVPSSAFTSNYTETGTMSGSFTFPAF